MLSLLTVDAVSQNVLHFLYLRHDNSVSTGEMVEKAKSFVKKYKNEKFVVYFSDANPLVMDNSNYNETELSGRITNQNSSTSVSSLAELRNVSETMERYNFTKLDMYCIVGSHFFEDGYHNSLVARLILVNDLNDESKMTLGYHSCGGTIKSNYLKFAERYNISIVPKAQ